MSLRAAQIIASAAAFSGAPIVIAQDAGEIAASGKFAAPLIPEGGHLVRAKGHIGFDASRGLWTFEFDDRVAGAAHRSIALLPAPALTDMVGVSPGGRSFELSSVVLAFEGTNYLLPSFATPLRREQERPEHALPPAPGSAPALKGPSAAPAPTDSGMPPARVDPEHFAAELERRLDSRIESVPESPVPAMPMIDTAPTPATMAANADEPIAAISGRLHRRRGTLTRDPITGTWRFILAAGRRDEGDTALEVLPCAQLAALISQARTTQNVALLITGDVEHYEGRGYLRPTRFERLKAGKGIGP